MSDEEQARVDRIISECGSTPPKRIYPDDVMFIIKVLARYETALRFYAKGEDCEIAKLALEG